MKVLFSSRVGGICEMIIVTESDINLDDSKSDIARKIDSLIFRNGRDA